MFTSKETHTNTLEMQHSPSQSHRNKERHTHTDVSETEVKGDVGNLVADDAVGTENKTMKTVTVDFRQAEQKPFVKAALPLQCL